MSFSQVLEIGAVGRAAPAGAPPASAFYAHSQAGPGFGDAAPLLAALQAAAEALPDGLKV